MSLQSISKATVDADLQARVISAAQKEAQNNTTLKETEVAKMLRRSPTVAINMFMWPVGIDYEDQYQYALETGIPNPGADEGVISDGNITAVINTFWPADSTLEPPPA